MREQRDEVTDPKNIDELREAHGHLPARRRFPKRVQSYKRDGHACGENQDHAIPIDVRPVRSGKHQDRDETLQGKPAHGIPGLATTQADHSSYQHHPKGRLSHINRSSGRTQPDLKGNR
jgi:hypothetical protein